MNRGWVGILRPCYYHITQPRTGYNAPTGPAGGDLGGGFPGPTVTGIQGTPVCVTAPGVGEVLTFDGSEWCPASSGTGGLGTITAVFDAGTVAITGTPEVDVYLKADGTIISWTILADAAAGATPVVIDIWQDTYSAYPPDSGDSITGSEKPTLTGVNKNQDLSLASGAGWPIFADSVLRFHMDSTSTVKRVELTLLYIQG